MISFTLEFTLRRDVSIYEFLYVTLIYLAKIIKIKNLSFIFHYSNCPVFDITFPIMFIGIKSMHWPIQNLEVYRESKRLILPHKYKTKNVL